MWYLQAVHATGGLTLGMTVLLLVGEMAGTGVLALPKALSDAGNALCLQSSLD